MTDSTFPTDDTCLYLLHQIGSPPQLEQPPHSPADPFARGCGSVSSFWAPIMFVLRSEVWEVFSEQIDEGQVRNRDGGGQAAWVLTYAKGTAPGRRGTGSSITLPLSLWWLQHHRRPSLSSGCQGNLKIASAAREEGGRERMRTSGLLQENCRQWVLPRVNLEWRVSCVYCISCLKEILSGQGLL